MRKAGSGANRYRPSSSARTAQASVAENMVPLTPIAAISRATWNSALRMISFPFRLSMNPNDSSQPCYKIAVNRKK